MPARTELALAALLAWAAGACGEPVEPAPPHPGPPGTAAKGPATGEAAGDRRSRTAGGDPAAAAAPSAEALLAAPPQTRWSNPGGLRWRVGFDAPVTSIRWTTLGGLVISVGQELRNVTSRGVARWSRIAGKGHRLFRVGGREVVWAPQFGSLSELLPRGGQGWTRRWDARVVGGELEEPLLVDAATVAAVGPDGEDKWRAALRGLRKLGEPFRCDGGMLIQGSRGLAGVAVTISSRGIVSRESELERGAIVVGASTGCDPLVWNGSEIALLDARGLHRWRREYASLPSVERTSRGFLLASGEPERPVRIESVSEDGRTTRSEELPLSGRFSRFSAIEGALAGVVVAGLCLNAESACSSLDGDRGPFNALLRISESGGAAVLERQPQGHVNLSALPGGGLVIASSADEWTTDVSFRDSSGLVRAAVTLPGRLSAGPFVGPGGEVYAATCGGWRCEAPHSLFSITGLGGGGGGEEEETR